MPTVSGRCQFGSLAKRIDQPRSCGVLMNSKSPIISVQPTVKIRIFIDMSSWIVSAPGIGRTAPSRGAKWPSLLRTLKCM